MDRFDFPTLSPCNELLAVQNGIIADTRRAIDSALTLNKDRTLMDGYAVRDLLLDLRNKLSGVG